MTVNKIIHSSIFSIGDNISNITTIHKNTNSNIIFNDQWLHGEHQAISLLYEVKDVYASIAKHKFISMQYIFCNKIHCFGRINLNYQRKAFGLLCEQFNSLFIKREEDNWETITIRGETVNVAIEYSDQYSKSTISYYCLSLIPPSFKEELNIP